MVGEEESSNADWLVVDPVVESMSTAVPLLVLERGRRDSYLSCSAKIIRIGGFSAKI